MSGAMAGSALVSHHPRCDKLTTVTLTVNNICNLACPHCYLQERASAVEISDATLAAIFASSCDHIAIVGKEPLANRNSIAIVEHLVRSARAAQKSVSLITNGLNAHLLRRETLQGLAWIDFSLDGGARSYEKYRRGSWRKLTRAVNAVRLQGMRDFRILQTLSNETLSAIPEMIEARLALQASLVIFSPYVITKSFGAQTVTMASPEAIVSALLPYSSDPTVRLMLDLNYLSHFDGVDGVMNLARRTFADRLIFIDSDPIDRGIVRVTYDGLVLTPFESIHTLDYAAKGRRLTERSLNDWFSELRHKRTIN